MKLSYLSNFIDHKSIEMNDSIKNANEKSLGNGIPQIHNMQLFTHINVNKEFVITAKELLI